MLWGVVCKHVYNQVDSNKLSYEYQSGFLPKHSIVHQLMELYNAILNSLENISAVVLYFVISFNKA